LNTYTIRDFRGGEQVKFYEKITEKDQNGIESFSIINLFPELTNNHIYHSLYKNFYSIYTSVKKNSVQLDNLKTQTSNSLVLYTSVFFDIRVTPYMHAFGQHLHQFKALYPNLNDFNQEGHEKFNDMETTYYFRCTNKDETCISQLNYS
jgi:hypothetical protein